jgi:hypothetical protein
MLLTQVNFPTHFLAEDRYEVWYSDRIYDRWSRACGELKRLGITDAFYNLGNKDLLRFGQTVVGEDFHVTGVAIVRYTNVSSGYPCPVIYVVQQGPTERRMGFPLVNEGPTQYESPYGNLNRHYVSDRIVHRTLANAFPGGGLE